MRAVVLRGSLATSRFRRDRFPNRRTHRQVAGLTQPPSRSSPNNFPKQFHEAIFTVFAPFSTDNSQRNKPAATAGLIRQSVMSAPADPLSSRVREYTPRREVRHFCLERGLRFRDFTVFNETKRAVSPAPRQYTNTNRDESDCRTRRARHASRKDRGFRCSHWYPAN